MPGIAVFGEDMHRVIANSRKLFRWPPAADPVQFNHINHINIKDLEVQVIRLSTGGSGLAKSVHLQA